VGLIPTPYTVHTHSMWPLSKGTLARLSQRESQCAAMAVCMPAPTFCCITTVTMYLNRLLWAVKLLRQCSTICAVQPLTLEGFHMFDERVACSAFLITVSTSSVMNSSCAFTGLIREGGRNGSAHLRFEKGHGRQGAANRVIPDYLVRISTPQRFLPAAASPKKRAVEWSTTIAINLWLI
jgi:hypothetical protein